MKLAAGVVLAGTVAGAIAISLPAGRGGTEPLPAEKPAGEIPQVVLDESVPRWFVDRFAGNSTAGPQFFQGPAPEVGGLGRPFVAPAPDGTVFLGSDGRIFKVTPEGGLLLVAGGGSNLGNCAAREAAVKVESIGYSPADESLYFLHRTIPCVRRLFQKDGEWRIEIAAGSPTDAGQADGEGGAARFKEPRSLAVASDGRVYVLDVGHILRKIEKGRVSTIQAFKGGKGIVDGPLAQATLQLTKMSGQICLGENDDTIYIADHWHFAVRKVDLKTNTISTPARSQMKRRPKGADGPAQTHVNFHSGCAFVAWDPVHKALWCGGPDEIRLRWLKDGWVRTVIPAKGNRYKWPQDAFGVPVTDTSFVWTHVRAVDNKGRAYIISGSSKTGVWRAYEKGGAQ